MFMEYSTYEPYSRSMPFSLSNFFVSDIILFYYLEDDNEDENPPPNAHLLPVGYFEHEPAPTSFLPIWVHTTLEETSDLIDQHHTHSKFQCASSILAQVSKLMI
jgi:hypothetical protein